MMTAILVIAFLLFLEMLFRILYLIRHRKPFRIVPKVPLKKIYIKSHPYLPYKYRESFQVENYTEALAYPLHKGKIFYAQPKLNNYGFIDGDLILEKPHGVLRVVCLGASTTANMISDGKIDYTYPDCLRILLKQKYPETKIEVMSFGVGGWTSAEILINFELTVLDFKPDIALLYHAFNDLEPSLTPGFKSDYSHARRNMAEKFYKYRIANILPTVPFLHSYEYLKMHLFGTGNIRNDLFSLTRVSKPDLNLPFIRIETEKRNISSLINICKGNNIHIILSSFVYYDYLNGRDLKANKYFEGVRLENKIMKDLSEEFKLPFVDIYNLIPKEERFFVDSVHFTPEGMKKISEYFLPEISKFIESKIMH